MSDFAIVTSCAPTLAGLKTGSLFTEPCTDRAALEQEIEEMNRILKNKGIRLTVVRYSEHRALIYMYRPAQLEEDLKDQEGRKILQDAGYRKLSADYCVRRLRQRFLRSSEFPHEIGLFLGYPSEDVKGYILHNGHNSKYVGYWKVYGDVSCAKKIFDGYRACTRSFFSRWTAGTPVQDLAVAV